MDNELNIVKDYLRIDSDITDEDNQINDLILAAHTYIENSTGKQYVSENIMLMLTKLLCSHWYTNRNETAKANVKEYSHSISDLLKHIENSSAYKNVGE